VSPERKAELVAEGYQIIDAVFAPVETETQAETEAPKPRGPKPKKVEA